jgi:endonuclease/exonuclease/phosphatase family metal-dependent hydrolase
VTPFVVASYNSHLGVGLHRRHDIARIAGVIEEIESHVIGLQLLYLDYYDTRQVPLRYWKDKRPEEVMREG